MQASPTGQQVDWHNNRRLLGPIGYITPAEAEEAFHANLNTLDMVAQSLNKSPSGKPGAVQSAPDGLPRLIEVKTTNGWVRTPFHITRNELAVAEERRSEWRLFRLWNFSREPKAFELHPPLNAHV